MKIKACIRSFRLRTLALSLAGSLLGILLANADYRVNVLVAILIVLTTVLLQILSNISNELGDFLSGTDNEDRQGPSYGMVKSDGKASVDALSPSQLKAMIYVFAFLSLISGLALIYTSFSTLFSMQAFCLVVLGISAIYSSMRYTLGKNPYGYRGLGDLFVFVYFGIVSVLGSYYISAHIIPTYYLVLPACSMGFLSMGVLNINNIRDMKSDMKTRKTLAIRLGLRGARIYQTVLILGAIAAALYYCHFRMFFYSNYLFLLSVPLLIYSLYQTWVLQDRALDKALPLLSISTLIFALLFGIGFNI